AIHLIQIEIARRRSRSFAALSLAAHVNRLHQCVDSVRFQQTRTVRRVAGIRSDVDHANAVMCIQDGDRVARTDRQPGPDRKSTRLNSSHRTISYAVFCLKKKTARPGESKSGPG